MRPNALAAIAAVSVLATAGSAAAAAPDQEKRPETMLRVCSDPDNMPFSDIRGAGFENRIAEILAADLGETVDYAWGAQYRGFLRRTLLAGECDVVMGISGQFPKVATSRPYYRSSYVFVSPAGTPTPSGFDDPALRGRRIGLHAIGMEGANTPPAMALARRSMSSSVVGFPVWGDEEGMQGKLINAVADGSVDVAIAWGPVAGYFAKPFGGRVVLAAVAGDPAEPDVPFAYDVSLGVRKDDAALLERLQGALDRRRPEIDAVLADFNVPRVDQDPAASARRPQEGPLQ